MKEEVPQQVIYDILKHFEKGSPGLRKHGSRRLTSLLRNLKLCKII